jgi:hypothetical protein
MSQAKLSPETLVPPEPLRIRLDRRADALALRRELAALGSVDLEPYGIQWELSLHGPKTDRVVNRVLEAVRRILEGRPSDVVQVLLDGRTYHMQGE